MLENWPSSTSDMRGSTAFTCRMRDTRGLDYTRAEGFLWPLIANNGHAQYTQPWASRPHGTSPALDSILDTISLSNPCAFRPHIVRTSSPARPSTSCHAHTRQPSTLKQLPAVRRRSSPSILRVLIPREMMKGFLNGAICINGIEHTIIR